MKSMKTRIDEKLRLTVNDENKYNEYKNKNLTVVLTVSFDFGWSKRSFGNRYDSILGHALKIDVLSDKMQTKYLLQLFLVKCALLVARLKILVKSYPTTSVPRIMKWHPKRWRQTLPFTSTKVCFTMDLRERAFWQNYLSWSCLLPAWFLLWNINIQVRKS